MQIDLVQCNISQLQSQSISLWADVVIMNPPFGTRRKGADLEFLRAAFQVCMYDMTHADAPSSEAGETCVITWPTPGMTPVLIRERSGSRHAGRRVCMLEMGCLGLIQDLKFGHHACSCATFVYANSEMLP